MEIRENNNRFINKSIEINIYGRMIKLTIKEEMKVQINMKDFD